ncbi:uncharacterized protein LOC126679384 [Mercurialis annua]|uniref:uncharacterized protein LOC126679384 n=1 Tax=Mercurialis annua TaxID=3986 RepID=UPI00215F3BB6|nr:uncharacterized protein LOC126679384 [Mercurialis annua]
MNNGYRAEDNSFCYFHPKEVIIGVCHLCLHERLVIIAAKQPSSGTALNHLKTPINIPKIFALGSLLNRLEFRHWKLSDHNSHNKSDDVSTSPEEDSFISIKFEDNGAALWEKGNNINNVYHQNNQNHMNYKQAKQDNNNKETLSVIEHAKPSATALRWRKRIGHLFQVIKLKRFNKGSNMCHVGTKVEGVKVMRKKGWIRSLTKRRS